MPTLPPANIVDTSGLGTVTISNPPARAISRLTRWQFLHSVEALLGSAANANVEPLLPKPIPNGGYANSGFAQSQAYDVIVAFDAASKQVAANISDWSPVFERYGSCTQYACVSTFIDALASNAFRRPATAAEIAALTTIAQKAEEEGLGYAEGAGLVVRAILQSPEFLYHFESDQLTQHQLASRLSFFVTDGPPDASLRDAADRQSLDSSSLRTHADRLLQAQGDRFGRAFVYDLLELRRVYQRVVPYDDEVLDGLVTSAQDTFARWISEDLDVAQLFTAQTFVGNPSFNQFVGASADLTLVESASTSGFLGLITHPATLIAMSNAVEGSTVSRGQFIAHRLLCVPPTPQPDANLVAEGTGMELPEEATARDHAEARLAAPRCGSCHAFFEPYAFGLNRWGGDGYFKDDPRLDDSGPISTTLGSVEFTGYQDFLPKLGTSEQFQRCMTDHLLRYGLRHSAYSPDLLDAVLTEARQNQPVVSFRQLTTSIVAQDAFQKR